MNLFIFRTDIKTKKKVESIKPFLNSHSNIIKWSIDLEDIDNVLRIEAHDNLHEDDIINLMTHQGYYCGDLMS